MEEWTKTERNYFVVVLIFIAIACLAVAYLPANAQKRPSKEQVLQTNLEKMRLEVEDWKGKAQLAQEQAKNMAFQNEQYLKELVAIRDSINRRIGAK